MTRKLASLGPTPLLLAVTLFASPALGHNGHALMPGGESTNPASASSKQGRTWLAGDHHIHSEFSADYKPDPEKPDAVPTPLFGRDGRYSIKKNAEMARTYGLSWMVSTDHGGPNHSRINHDLAYPALEESRRAVPEVLQFFGMELDTPAGDHSSLIIPLSGQERAQLFDIESRFSQKEAWPADPARDQPSRMIEALKVMGAQPLPPVLFANHPSRSAPVGSKYGRYTPEEFRNWNDAAPKVSVGMEGAPGHQAGALKPDGTLDPVGRRGGYAKLSTIGGFDPMTAKLGGLWDAMLGEGRRWWITATSDSHNNWRDGGNDFWPGEYSKTYVLARRDHGDILDGLRHGRIFVTTGDLVSEVHMSAHGARASKVKAGLGELLTVPRGDDVVIEICVRDPKGVNSAKLSPEVRRIDLISGRVTGPAQDRSTDINSTTQVVHRFTKADWKREGEVLVMRHRLPKVTEPLYLRIRGTNTDELEPAEDQAGENPWADLWFYANPVFVDIAK